MVARNDASTRTCVLNFIYGIIIRTAVGLLAEVFAKGRASGRYIHLFDQTFLQIYKFTRKVKILSLPETTRKIRRFERKPSVGWNFHQKVEFFFVISGSERSYTFRVLLNALRTYTGNVMSRYFNKLQSLYNHLLSIGLILFCRRTQHWGRGTPPPFSVRP